MTVGAIPTAVALRSQRAKLETTAIYQKLTGIMRDVFENETIIARPDLTAENLEEWNSLGGLRLVLEIEQSFNIKLTALEIGKVKNVGEFVELIKSKTKGKR